MPRSRSWRRLGLGFLPGKKKEGEESKWTRAASLTSKGGQGARGAAVEAVVGRGHGDRDPTVATGTMELTGGSPLSGF